MTDMKKNKIYFITLLLFSLVGCNKFLDKNPDNRVELDSADKIQKFLVSAYPNRTTALVTEFSSDNIDDIGEGNRRTLPFISELVYWDKNFHEYGARDGLRNIWSDNYSMIYHANVALEAIENLGENTPELRASKGEALVIRAYAHFILVNLFGKHYNTQTSNTDLGVPYLEESINEFKAERSRNTVADVYQRIERDLIQGLELINDSYYKVPKLHFNKRAAQAFAARFYLYYEKWDQAEAMATQALGGVETPTTLRNWGTFQALSSEDPHAKEYTRDDLDANIFLATVHTNATSYIDGTAVARFTHGAAISVRETFRAENNLWQNNYKDKAFERYRTEISKYTYTKYPTYVNNRSQIVLFSTDETLLVRAEARILQKNYVGAISDLNLFTKGYLTAGTQFTQNEINTGYQHIEYSSYDTTTMLSHATQKKHLYPAFSIDSEQENLLHFLLQCRRLLTLGEGLRWYDIRRYGIEIYRHQLDNEGTAYVKAILSKDDKRRTLPLPVDVVAAGMQQNER
ncbi:hypothetical protein HMPREF9071_0438 [Capnocytophaga sp. oral taxon 338 str. F0234]|nr:hypothetical protein HMPREF9071_0438 [Capnocytophaga sp. oral taxon 338 str. F0234]